MPAALLRLRSDEQLVALLRAGSDEAFCVIHDRYQARLLAYCRQMLGGSHADAEDVLQDVFVRALPALRSNDTPIALRAWLYRIAHNRCVDGLRRPAPMPTEIMPGAQPALSRGANHDPPVEAERNEDLQRLVRDLLALPEQQRSALLMRELQGLSYEELAASLGVSVGAVKSLLVRARDGVASAAVARDAPCAEIRLDLAEAHDRGVRPSGHARRHLRECPGCRQHRLDLRRTTSQLAALVPPVGLLGQLALMTGLGGGGTGGGLAVAGGGAGSAAGTGGGAAAVCGIAGATAGKVAAIVCVAALVGGAGDALTQASAPASPVPRAHARTTSRTPTRAAAATRHLGARPAPVVPAHNVLVARVAPAPACPPSLPASSAGSAAATAPAAATAVPVAVAASVAPAGSGAGSATASAGAQAAAVGPPAGTSTATSGTGDPAVASASGSGASGSAVSAAATPAPATTPGPGPVTTAFASGGPSTGVGASVAAGAGGGPPSAAAATGAPSPCPVPTAPVSGSAAPVIGSAGSQVVASAPGAGSASPSASSPAAPGASAPAAEAGQTGQAPFGRSPTGDPTGTAPTIDAQPPAPGATAPVSAPGGALGGGSGSGGSGSASSAGAAPPTGP